MNSQSPAAQGLSSPATSRSHSRRPVGRSIATASPPMLDRIDPAVADHRQAADRGEVRQAAAARREAARLSVHTTVPVSARSVASSPEPKPATTSPSGIGGRRLAQHAGRRRWRPGASRAAARHRRRAPAAGPRWWSRTAAPPPRSAPSAWARRSCCASARVPLAASSATSSRQPVDRVERALIDREAAADVGAVVLLLPCVEPPDPACRRRCRTPRPRRRSPWRRRCRPPPPAGP